MTAKSIMEALGGWRGMCHCPAHQDKTPSLSLTEKDGKILVHCHAGCQQADVIAALRARGLWPESNWTPSQRRDFAKQKARDETDLRDARMFADAATILAQQCLEDLDFWDSKRAVFTRLVSSLRTDAEMLSEYRAWRDRDPKLTAGLVHAGRRHQQRINMMLADYLMSEVQHVA